MGIQKYRADREGDVQPNGALPAYTLWMGGPSLALVRNCPCEDGERRTVYVQGEPDTYFSQPAAASIRGKRVTGWLSSNERGYFFNMPCRADSEAADYEAVKDAARWMETARSHPNWRVKWFVMVAFRGLPYWEHPDES